MPTYKVVFTNGEKKELEVCARTINPDSTQGVVKFVKDSSKTAYAAVVPLDRILYIVEVDEG